MLDAQYRDGRIDVAACGIRPSHDAGFFIDWRPGSREYGVVLFHNAVILEDRHGRSRRPPGTSIVYLPYQPRFYCGAGETVDHTWILADGPGVSRCIADYAIPDNLALELGELDFFLTYINDVRQERVLLQEHYEDAITDLSWEFFRRLGALIAENADPLTAEQRRKVRMLSEIRLRVHSDLAHRWTVSEMASLEGLNPTLFATDYRARFGTSPVDDLIDARLRRAEYLLKHVSLTAKQIAKECGFSSAEHFSRLFHTRRGYSPGQFRKL